MSTAFLGGQAQGGGSEEAVTLPFPLQPECGLGAGKEEVGGTEEACPLGEGASGQQLPVWFQAGGPAHLMTEEPFMGLGSRDRGRAGMEATQVRVAREPACGRVVGGQTHACPSQMGPWKVRSHHVPFWK